MPNQKTTTTLIPIPYEWLDDYVVKYGGENNDYEVAANAIGENGVSLWESCVAGLNPDVETSKFFAKIVVGNDGSINVTWEPDLSNDPVRRIYKVQGCRVLGEEWVEVNVENINQYHFFKVMLVGIEE